MRIILLFLFCGTIFGTNDTLNEIPISENGNRREEPVEGPPVTNLTIEEMFEKAVEAYLEEDWDRCIEGFNRALHGHKLYKRMVINCRQKCRAQADGSTPFFPENIEDLHFYERKVKETLCLLTCNQDYLQITGPGALMRPSKETEQKIYDHKYYDYLHLCYYQRHRYQDAANALYTYLVRHPDHEVTISTLKHYLTLPGVSEDEVINLESSPYLQMYFKGVTAYEDEDYKEAAGFFESSLRSYLGSEEECRFYCEGPFDQGWLPEFTSSVANHFAYCLKCKRGCSHTLNNMNGDYRSDTLRSHYDYLQFSYYKLGNLKAACQALESYLLFAPADEERLQNKEYFRKQPKVMEEYFTPREEAVSYLKRQEYEIKILRYIAHEFMAIDERFEKYGKNKTLKNKKKKTPESTQDLGKVKNR